MTPVGTLSNSSHTSPCLSVSPTLEYYANAIYFHHSINHQNDKNLVEFYHKMFGCPPASTFIKDITFLTDLQHFPGLTLEKIRKNLPHDPITTTGHFKRVKQGLRSTKPKPVPLQLSTDNNLYAFTIAIHDQQDLQTLFSKLRYTNKTLYADLMDRFPITSTAGHKYICVFYHAGKNYIHLVPMKTRLGREYKLIFEAALEFFESHLTIISRFVMDNETSADVETFLDSKNLPFQYVPPNNHRANQAERAINTAKSHIISSINVTDRSFDLSHWPALFPQIEITLNWMRVSTTNPRLSAYADMHGAYNYDKHPMAPLGTKVLFYQSKSERSGTWDDKGKEGHYVGPSIRHYRSYYILASATDSFLNTDTVIFYPERYIIPGVFTCFISILIKVGI